MPDSGGQDGMAFSGWGVRGCNRLIWFLHIKPSTKIEIMSRKAKQTDEKRAQKKEIVTGEGRGGGVKRER